MTFYFLFFPGRGLPGCVRRHPCPRRRHPAAAGRAHPAVLPPHAGVGQPPDGPALLRGRHHLRRRRVGDGGIDDRIRVRNS